jgi:hypothetical protein
VFWGGCVVFWCSFWVGFWLSESLRGVFTPARNGRLQVPPAGRGNRTGVPRQVQRASERQFPLGQQARQEQTPDAHTNHSPNPCKGNKARNTRKVQTQGTVRNETTPYPKRRQTMPYTQQQTGLSVGIDGSKDTLPIAPYPTEQGWEMPNQPSSWHDACHAGCRSRSRFSACCWRVRVATRKAGRTTLQQAGLARGGGARPAGPLLCQRVYGATCKTDRVDAQLLARTSPAAYGAPEATAEPRSGTGATAQSSCGRDGSS